MPKRIPTPPLADNTNYFTVYFPYPLNANWELKADQITFARWIACIIPNHYFSAIMYKPSARGMVLVEIDREFKEHRLLLGEHKWNEFLRQPTDEEKSCSTQIFYSTYSNHRAAQKDGWLTIHVQDSWFNDFSPTNKIIMSPYPSTHWCAPPAEDRTNKAMCRPLPVASFPPPPKAPKQVVGSTQWVQSNNAPAGANPLSRAAQQSAWNSGKPIPTPSANQPAPKAWGSQKSAPAPRASTSSQPLQGAWGAQRPATVTSATGAWGTNKSVGPPGLPTPPTNVPSAPPGLVRSNQHSGSSTGSLDRASDAAADSAINSSNAEYNELMAHTGKMSVSDSMEQKLLGIGDDEDDHETNYAAFEFPHMGAVTTVGYQARSESIKEDLWANIKTEEPEDEELLCPTHGVLCTKGICKDKSDLVRRKEREAKLAANAGKKSGGGGGKKKGGWRSGNKQDDNAGFVRRDSRTNSSTNSSANGGSRSVSRANSTLPPVTPFDHDDEADPWGEEQF